MTEMTLEKALAEVKRARIAGGEDWQPREFCYPGYSGDTPAALAAIANAVASGDLITKAEIERGLADPVVVNYNMLRGTIAKPSLAQIVHVYAGDLITKADNDAAYLERNKLVALLAAIFPSGIKRTAIPGWSDDWHGCVYIDFPWGQASWHYHDSHADLFAHLPPYEGEWNGHTTAAKYDAIVTVAKSRLDLIPRTDAEQAVALAYQRAVAAAPDDIEIYRLIKKSGLRKHGQIARLIGDHLQAISANTLALAPAEPLAEVERMRRQIEAVCRAHMVGAERSVALEDRAEAAEAEVARLREALHDAYSHQLAACAEWEGEMAKARGAASHKVAAARYAGHYSAANDLAKRIAALAQQKDATP